MQQTRKLLHERSWQDSEGTSTLLLPGLEGGRSHPQQTSALPREEELQEGWRCGELRQSPLRGGWEKEGWGSLRVCAPKQRAAVNPREITGQKIKSEVFFSSIKKALPGKGTLRLSACMRCAHGHLHPSGSEHYPISFSHAPGLRQNPREAAFAGGRNRS